MFNKNAFNDFIIENDVIGFFEKPILLKSGRLSPWYVNWRKISVDVFLTDKLTDFILSFLEEKSASPECFYGVPEGATKIALITQFKWAKRQRDYKKGRYSLPMGRGRPKEHGDPKDRFFIGFPRGRTIVIEDTVTTGDSLLKSIQTLKDAGVSVNGVLILTNRSEKRNDGKTIEEVINDLGIDCFIMSDALSLLPLAYAKNNPGERVREAVKAYFRRYGTKEVSL